MANIKSFPNNQDVYIGAADVMRWHHGRTSGVFAAGGNAAVQALASPGMAVKVTNGTGWLSNANGDGIVWWIDTEQNEGVQLAIDQADSVLHRIDRVIIEWKTTTYVDYPEVKILKGTPASTPEAPALTNDGNVRQISLAQIYVKAGSTSVTSSAITDERLNTSVCGKVTESVSADTSVVEAQFMTMLGETQTRINNFLETTNRDANNTLDAIANRLAEIESNQAMESKKLLFSGVTVSVDSFAVDDTYQDYPFRAAVELKNKDGENVVLSSMIPNVVYSVAALTDNNFAPVAECYNGGVYIYADSKPSAPVNIDTIICWKG
jgi:hypothetical protein